MQLDKAHKHRENAKREARKSPTRRLPDGTPVSNKPYNVSGEVQLKTIVRRGLNRGQRRRIKTELHEVTKLHVIDDTLDIRGKLLPNLISASAHITS